MYFVIKLFPVGFSAFEENYGYHVSVCGSGGCVCQIDTSQHRLILSCVLLGAEAGTRVKAYKFKAFLRFFVSL